jgi:hypothetical protein
LRDYQEFTASLGDVEVHLSVRVGKYAKAEGFVEEVIGIGWGILSGNTEKDHKAFPDGTYHFTPDLHVSLNHSLNNGAHVL